ncbi:hypothetical protein HanIR_Chr06g0257131 [Helianthus annuus]|nr:hypothetical protein HanIR_Chr06g0257131 [Helianthus annuus]
MIYSVDLQEDLHASQPTVEAIVFGCKLEALLGRYRMHYLDRSQGPPVYPCFEGAKHVTTSLDGANG